MKRNFFLQSIFFMLIFISLFFISSCKKSIGYSVLLWDVPESNLQDGQIVKVLIKSNISKVYVISHPETNEKIEVPLWQLSEPSSKKKVIATQQKYADFAHDYAKIKVDGLPVRSDPVNTSRQVYRLHKDEIVKILYKGEGQAVMVGKDEQLEGDWLCVLTTGGTKGWCFSYNLALFTTGAKGEIVSGEVQETEVNNDDAILNQVLQAKWYPDSYTKLLADNTIDLDVMKKDYGFDTGASSGKITVNIKDRYHTATYNGITKVRDSVYDFNGTAFQMIIASPNQISVNYSGGEGNPEVYTFVTISKDYDIPTLIQDEKNRRIQELQNLYNVDSFESANYGTLIFTNNNSFIWNDFEIIVPNIIPYNARASGKVSIKYLLSPKLKRNFDGVLTFNFDDTGDDDEVNFFYSFKPNGLFLEDASEAKFKGNIVQSSSPNSLVITFSRQQ